MPAVVCQLRLLVSIDHRRDTCQRPCRVAVGGISGRGEAGDAFSSPRRVWPPEYDSGAASGAAHQSSINLMGYFVVEYLGSRGGSGSEDGEQWKASILGAMSICEFPRRRGARRTETRRHGCSYVSEV